MSRMFPDQHWDIFQNIEAGGSVKISQDLKKK